MKVYIWVWRHVPLTAFVWFGIIVRVWNWAASNLEAAWWWRRGREAREIMPLLEESIGTVYALSEWYATKGFTQEKGGRGRLFGCGSKPWVSVAKNHGDYEDMARLSEWILRGKYPWIYRVTAYGADGIPRTVLLVKDLEDRWFRVICQFFQEFRSFEEALHTHRDDVVFWHIW